MVTLTYQERFKTLKGVFDEFTNRTLFDLQSKGLFDEIISPIFVGKESNVFLAKSGKKKVIVKIYRMQNCDFNKMFDYIRKDPRYEFLKKHRRQIILSWAQREYKNLIRAKKAKINSPEALGWKNHIIVEEFIGEGDIPASPLKDEYPENPNEFFKIVINQMKQLYKEGIIHGDLSSFNILNYKQKPYFIDYSQATLVRTPNSEELLERDVKNIIKFFSKFGIDADFEETIKKIKA
ncbi:MAG: serine protein kinase RIO [Nanoarchaeota archaeon]|nr:serine protein kinase RIO [Nanoarchaeota archaeon]MBU1632054.1 serine protein kinase RIO [Nanoarchaeota archaeon]MBU1875819.1 serine protein kinase RIO [Nanoarchaeota archaeon]